jgi:hypothetical protein
MRIKGKQVRYWDKWGTPQTPAQVVLSEIELPPVNQLKLKDGDKVLLIGIVDGKYIRTGLHSIGYSDNTGVAAILPEPEKVYTIDDIKNRFSENIDKVMDNAVKTGIGVATVVPEKFFETKRCDNCGNMDEEGHCAVSKGIPCAWLNTNYPLETGTREFWKPKPEPKEQPIDWEGLKFEEFHGASENAKKQIKQINQLIGLVQSLHSQLNSKDKA